jgi:hypothetical protein
MKISKTHRNFAIRLNSQEVLTHPENYLGLNWEAVIDFWLYLDTLSKEQFEIVRDRYWDLSYEERSIAKDKAWEAAADATDFADDASYSAFDSVFCAKPAAEYATKELIGLDKLLEQGHQPVFFPMFLNP